MAVSEMRCRFNVEIPMRDGTILRGDLYIPELARPCPALLMRTVFRKKWMGRAFGQYDPGFFTRNGYAVLFQDVRGLGESDGEFDRFTADGRDGYDTIEWMAAQPWCNGQIGMMGNYYAGYLQLMAARENPPHLRAICPMQTSVSINRDCDNRGFLFSSHIGWCISRQINRLMDGRYSAEVTGKYLPLLQAAIRDYPTVQLSALPICEMPLLKDAPFPIFQDYVRHLLEGYDDLSLLEKEGRNLDTSQLQTPAFYISGWFDSARTPMLEHCVRQRRMGVESQVLIAPWKVGESPARADSALEDGLCTLDLQQEMLTWFDWHLKGIAANVQPIRYFDIAAPGGYMGSSWPEGEACRTLFLNGRQALSDEADNAASALLYLHDPARPLPYQPFGPCAYPQTDARRVLCVSEPVDAAQRICGLVRARMYVSATTKDADVMLTLLDVAPDGQCFAVCDGATRARYRQDWVSRPLEPGQVVCLEVLMGQTLYTLAPGHRWALALYGSAFPKYDVNHCTAERPAHDGRMLPSEITVHCGRQTPSSLLLPLG